MDANALDQPPGGLRSVAAAIYQASTVQRDAEGTGALQCVPSSKPLPKRLATGDLFTSQKLRRKSG